MKNQIKEIQDWKKYSKELMDKIIRESTNWKIDKDGNYENDQIGEIIHSNNFSFQQNEQLKKYLRGKVILENFYRPWHEDNITDFQRRGREGKIKKGGWHNLELYSINGDRNLKHSIKKELEEAGKTKKNTDAIISMVVFDETDADANNLEEYQRIKEEFKRFNNENKEKKVKIVVMNEKVAYQSKIEIQKK
jgi:hypothetical protein